MSVKCQVIMDAMDKMAPRFLAEEWDNPGLQVGSPAQKIEKVMVCLDFSEGVLDYAKQHQVDMIISHHPFIFRPMKNLRIDLPQGRLLAELIKNDIVLFAAHTNLDTAKGGVNDVLAERLGIVNTRPLTEQWREEMVKLAVYVPQTHAEAVREALGRAGAGYIGNYSHCSFSAAGEGRFLPLAGTQPFIGQQGELATVAEARIETIFPLRQQRRIIKAMLKAHPYEEAAYDIYPLRNTGDVNGLGRIGELADEITFGEFLENVKENLALKTIRYSGDLNRKIKKAALCSGSGAEFIQKAAFAGADVYITGDVKYHDAQRAVENNICLVDAGHYGTEFPVVDSLKKRLQQFAEKNKLSVEIIADTFSQDLLNNC